MLIQAVQERPLSEMSSSSDDLVRDGRLEQVASQKRAGLCSLFGDEGVPWEK